MPKKYIRIEVTEFMADAIETIYRVGDAPFGQSPLKRHRHQSNNMFYATLLEEALLLCAEEVERDGFVVWPVRLARGADSPRLRRADLFREQEAINRLLDKVAKIGNAGADAAAP